MNRAAVYAEATVVSSLIVTDGGDFEPSRQRRASASPVLAAGAELIVPPFATT